jgi:hypothetical protein
VQVSNPGASKQRINSPSQNKVVVVEKRFDNAQLPFSFAYPGSWKIDSTGNHNEMAKVEDKMDDLNTKDVEKAMKIVAGTARSMGVKTDTD